MVTADLRTPVTTAPRKPLRRSSMTHTTAVGTLSSAEITMLGCQRSATSTGTARGSYSQFASKSRCTNLRSSSPSRGAPVPGHHGPGPASAGKMTCGKRPAAPSAASAAPNATSDVLSGAPAPPAWFSPPVASCPSTPRSASLTASSLGPATSEAHLLRSRKSLSVNLAAFLPSVGGDTPGASSPSAQSALAAMQCASAASSAAAAISAETAVPAGAFGSAWARTSSDDRTMRSASAPGRRRASVSAWDAKRRSRAEAASRSATNSSSVCCGGSAQRASSAKSMDSATVTG
mmetsp:Transcript_16680/g.56662  ORF Transcript_16680/g.56662 Transcript_16680/m.56662 type:complete len:291 (+) Transcript_16680:370-1242(+)